MFFAVQDLQTRLQLRGAEVDVFVQIVLDATRSIAWRFFFEMDPKRGMFSGQIRIHG